MDRRFFYLLPVNEEDELVRPGPGLGPGLGNVHPPHAVGALRPLLGLWLTSMIRTAAAHGVNPPLGGVSCMDPDYETAPPPQKHRDPATPPRPNIMVHSGAKKSPAGVPLFIKV